MSGCVQFEGEGNFEETLNNQQRKLRSFGKGPPQKAFSHALDYISVAAVLNNINETLAKLAHSNRVQGMVANLNYLNYNMHSRNKPVSFMGSPPRGSSRGTEGGSCHQRFPKLLKSKSKSKSISISGWLYSRTPMVMHRNRKWRIPWVARKRPKRFRCSDSHRP